MKRITLFFAVLLGLSAFQTAFGVDSETARAAKRSSANTISTNTTSTRSTSSSKSTEQKHNENARSTVKNNRSGQSVQPRTVTTKPQPTIRQRSATSVQKTNVKSKTVSARSSSTGSRGTPIARSAVSRKATNAKPTVTRSAVNKKNNHIVRAAELNEDKINEIKARDFSKCKTVYWDCMDEFCANKDTTLRRCACSTRIHEFDDIKQQLNDTEEKMLGFNQTLLTVSLDKEDALAINTATEGELAFEQKDTSESEKLLQKITNTLNTSSDSKLNSNLSAISLDLDMESAWDTVDATSGIATTAKSGLGLYNAAQPVCLEMAREVCSDSEFSIAENSYKLAIQQDCDTVANAYKSKYNEAINKVHESSALLDMARLNAYQQRNSDDVLTCKQKILDKLSEPAVCGEKLYRCLDITGKYIDQSDGSAFLSEDLFNMTNLLTAPSSTDIKWSRVSGNEQFVTFLNSKRKYLESATEKCQDVADMVWKDFIEDALAQIKLAQNAKLEEIRRSCVKLVAECKTNARTSIENFDANAISTFKILADITVNEMCSDVQSACMVLIDSSLDNTEWSSALAGIETDMTYESIIENCTAVGRTCIIQHCNGTNGNFALCENTNSDPRQLILKMRSCWDEVQECVSQVKPQTLAAMGLAPEAASDTVYKTCNNNEDNNDPVCLITHKIWGDCSGPTFILDPYVTPNTNSTIQTDDTSTLLAWFAEQTNNNKCQATPCPSAMNYFAQYGDYKECNMCASKIITTDRIETDSNHMIEVSKNPEITNYCEQGCAGKDSWGNCCADTIDDTNDTRICVPNNYKAVEVQNLECTSTSTEYYYCPYSNKKITLYCITDNADSYPMMTDTGITCGTNGYWVLIDQYGNYFNPANVAGRPIYQTDINYQYPTMSFKNTISGSTELYEHKIEYHPGLVHKWTPNEAGPRANKPNQLMIQYLP